MIEGTLGTDAPAEAIGNRPGQTNMPLIIIGASVVRGGSMKTPIRPGPYMRNSLAAVHIILGYKGLLDGRRIPPDYKLSAAGSATTQSRQPPSGPG
jgi:hypothetical protein